MQLIRHERIHIVLYDFGHTTHLCLCVGIMMQTEQNPK